MTTFVDTSALYALLDGRDPNHGTARTIWEGLLSRDEPLLTHSYVIVETFALVQRRLGLEAVMALNDALLPMLTITWVDEDPHSTAVAALIEHQSRQISLVDRVSFELMRRHGTQTAFAFDQDFEAEGYSLARR